MAMDESDAAMHGLPPELIVTADGPVRIVTLNRPDELKAPTA